MANQKSNKRALILSLFAVLMCILMLTGTTFAWFTDSVTSSGNKIQAGTLELDLELLDKERGKWNSVKADKTPLFSNDKWEPGYTEAKLLKVENNGNLTLKWVAKFVSDNALGALADVIDVYVLPYGVLSDASNVSYPANRDLVGYTRVGTLKEFVNTIKETTYGTLKGGEAAYLGIAIKMQETVGNDYQGKKLGKFDIQIIATQAADEEDTFNNEYDKDVTYPVVVNSPQTLKEAMLEKGAKIVLEDDIVVDADTPTQWGSYLFVANGKEVTIDLNGHDIILEKDAKTDIVYMFTTANGGTLNITGEGNLISKNDVSGICWAMNKNDQINIYGGNFDSTGTNWSTGNSLIYTTSGSIDVYGGKFYRSGSWCANVHDGQGSRVCIVFHEGVLFKENDIQNGDSARIKLADGCVMKQVTLDGQIWYQVVKE